MAQRPQSQDDYKLIWPHLRQFNDDIETKSGEWSSEVIDETQQSLSLIISRLNNVRNSRLAINKLAPDILYIIFTLVVYCPGPSTAAALRISHVCHHWRKFALEWPVLWAFVDLKNSLTMTELFMKRSQNSPLTLIWDISIDSPIALEKASSYSYFVLHAKSILSRLCSLRIFTSYINFISLYCVVRDSISLPLQLQFLDIFIDLDSIGEDRLEPPPLQHIFDNSCLQEIILWGLDLPWTKLPRNRLTQFILRNPPNPPALSQLLSFLSNCPCLNTLELANDDYDHNGIKREFPPTTLTSLRAIQRLDLPKLTELELGAQGPASYYYIWQFAWCIQTFGTLSSFKLIYDVDFPEPSDETTIGTSSFQIFGAVPPGAFSHFSNYQFLIITADEDSSSLSIRGQALVDDNFHHDKLVDRGFPEHPFQLECGSLNLPFRYSAILELLFVMPHIRHLSMKSYAWKILTLPNINVPRIFPHLRTVELIDCDTEALNTLQALIPANFSVKRLILSWCVISFDALFSVVISIGAEILELVECEDMDADGGPDEMISALRDSGVEVVWKNSGDPEA